MNLDNRYKLTGLAIFVVSIATLFVIVRTIHNLTQIDIDLARRNIEEQAVVLFRNIVTVRSWSASHGGVYVKQKPGMKPNPYLKNGSTKTASGETLILVNPAWMTRQIFELMRQKKGRENHYYKITSPDPVNPKNAPDLFEKRAFEYFQQNPEKKYYFVYPDENPDELYFMGLLRAEKGCLTCHKKTKVGDIRGGIRITIPITIFRENERHLSTQSKYLIAFISILAFLVAFVTLYLFRTLERNHREIKAANDALERRVRQRTEKISNMHRKELHLRRIMQTIATVNKEIINFHSLDTLLVHICNIIAGYGNNHFCFIDVSESSHSKKRYFSSEVEEGSVKRGLEEAFLKLKQWHVVLQSIKNGRPLIVNDLLKQAEFAELHHSFQEPGIRSFGVFPIPAGKKRNGAIFVFSRVTVGFPGEEIRMFDELTGDLGFAIDAYGRQKDISLLKSEKLRNFEETILSLIHLIEERDSYTAGHSLRVAHYCSVIGKHLKLSARNLRRLEKASILHDLGKIATPDSILLRPGKLSGIEYDLVKLHVRSGYEVLKKVKVYRDLAEIIRYHHEWYDGSGYPEGIAGDDIPLLSRILSIADAFDAMTTDRVYRMRKSKEAALKEIRSQIGIQFHPEPALEAIQALEKTDVLETVYVFPQTDFEKKRFAYFFNDQLSELYNEDYFFLFLQDKERMKLYANICFVSLKNFSDYNRTFGWDSGDDLLKEFSKNLEKNFPDSMVFRIQGDDFIVLTPEHSAAIQKQIPLIPSEKKGGVSIQFQIVAISDDRIANLTKRSIGQFFATP